MDEDSSYPNDTYSLDDTDEVINSCFLASDNLQVLGVLIGIIFCFFLCCAERRKQCGCCTHCCCCCGMIVAVNFLENNEDRAMVVSAFILMADGIIDVMIAPIPVPWPILKMLCRILLVFLMCLKCLPLLASIGMESLASQFLAILYVIIYVILDLLSALKLCEVEDDDSSTKLIRPILSAIIYTPAVLYLILSYLKRINDIRKGKSLEFSYLWKNYQILYVKQLLDPPKKDISSNSKVVKGMKALSRICCSTIPGFRYSLIILISVAVGFVCALSGTIQAIAEAMIYYFQIRDFILEYREMFEDIEIPNIMANIAGKIFKKGSKSGESMSGKDIKLLDFIISQVDVVFWSIFTSLMFTFVLMCCSFILMLLSYKKVKINMRRQLYRNEGINLQKKKPVDLVVSAIQYGGFQIAHIIWGFLLQFLIFFIIFFVIGELIIVPLVFDNWQFFLTILRFVTPYLVVFLLTRIIQWFLVKKFFLEDNGRILAIRNRKGFYNMMYFMFFYNVLVGFVGCLLRMVKSMVFGLWFFPRLDCSIFPRTFESLDGGFVSYLSLLRLEDIQSNNILRLFVYLLIHRRTFVNRSRISRKENLSPSELKSHLKSKASRNRWFVAWTLINNPQLTNQRKHSEYLDKNQNENENLPIIKEFGKKYDYLLPGSKNVFLVSKTYTF